MTRRQMKFLAGLINISIIGGVLFVLIAILF